MSDQHEKKNLSFSRRDRGGGNVVDVLRVACVCVGCWILLSECEMICFGVETHTSVPSIFSNL